MKKLTLAAAKLVAKHTRLVPPVIRQREGQKVNIAEMAVARAEHAAAHAKEEDKAVAENELRLARMNLDMQRSDWPKLAAAAVQQLKKLAHPTDKTVAPIRLPPRRLRREAARLLAADARRTAAEERRLSG